MRTLAKYIVIPINNLQYMIKGINIGGVNRIEYLNYLNQKQEENILQLEKSYAIDIFKEQNNNLNFITNNASALNMNLNIENITQNFDSKTKDASNSIF